MQTHPRFCIDDQNGPMVRPVLRASLAKWAKKMSAVQIETVAEAWTFLWTFLQN